MLTEFEAGVQRGKLEMFGKVTDLFMNIVIWADDNLEHDDTNETCDVCTILDELQLGLLTLGMNEGSKG